jgi:hypothetical protein
MDFMNLIAIVISSIFTSTMTNRSMRIAPFVESCINVIFVCINHYPYSNRRLNQRFDCLLLDILQHLDAYFSRALNHAHNRRFFAGQRAAPPGPSEPIPSSRPPVFPDRFRMPLMPGNYINFITFYFPTELKLWLFF